VQISLNERLIKKKLFNYFSYKTLLKTDKKKIFFPNDKSIFSSWFYVNFINEKIFIFDDLSLKKSITFLNCQINLNESVCFSFLKYLWVSFKIN
jgi:hypothetical protein